MSPSIYTPILRKIKGRAGENPSYSRKPLERRKA